MHHLENPDAAPAATRRGRLGRAGSRALVLALLVMSFSAATLGFGATDALAAFSARVQAGTLTLTGNGASDTLVLRLEPGAPNILQADVGGDGVADFSFDRSTFTAVVVAAGRGDDTLQIDRSGGTFTDEAVTLDGGDGSDRLLGGDGDDRLVGGRGDDFLDGNRGSDNAQLGAGNDRFQWDPGDGSDSLEGQGGNDQLDFNGSNANEQIELAANGRRLQLSRDIAAISIDSDGIETVNLRTLGGSDTVTVDDLAATDIKTTNIDLNANTATADGSPDTVITKATNQRDRVLVSRLGTEVSVDGLAASTRITGSDPTLDTLQVQTLDGDDDVSVDPGVSDLIGTIVDLGNDE
jgi:Ca2+-binding RTX toxin-like protein